MRRREFITFLGGGGLLFTQVLLARSDTAVDRLSLPDSIEFNGESYRLSWSSHPNPYYYKQEYLPPGQTSERFQRMLSIEAIVRGVDVNGAVNAQVTMLNKRKSTDPTVNFALVKNPKNDEIILDFILSTQDSKGTDIIEWNAYRYAAFEREGRRVGRALVWNKSACLWRRCNKLSPQTEIGAPGRGQCTRRLSAASCSADGLGFEGSSRSGCPLLSFSAVGSGEKIPGHVASARVFDCRRYKGQIVAVSTRGQGSGNH
jgi:hypothetical protein